MSYWEQRGCGAASVGDARSVSLAQQVDDLRAILRWLHGETREPVVVLAISLGAAIALRAVENDRDHSTALIAISPDLQTAMSDASADEFLQRRSAGKPRFRATVQGLGRPHTSTRGRSNDERDYSRTSGLLRPAEPSMTCSGRY